MCTAVSLVCGGLYFGRTLDLPSSLGQETVITPRSFPIPLRHLPSIPSHFAFIGTAKIENRFPLYFDGANEKGLCAAALAFRESAKYHPYKEGALNLASFELIPYILSSFSSVESASENLASLNITADSFSSDTPPSPLHFIISDSVRSAVIESCASGVKIYDNPIGILTNEPPFPIQLLSLLSHPLINDSPPLSSSSFLSLSGDIEGADFSGNYTSSSRFIRASLEKLASEKHLTEGSGESALFSILSSVSMLRGYRLPDGDGVYRTVYSSCFNSSLGRYSFIPENSLFPTSFELSSFDLDSSSLISPSEDG